MAGESVERYEMLFCDRERCRVNTFERGRTGKCPGCDSVGKSLPKAGSYS